MNISFLGVARELGATLAVQGSKKVYTLIMASYKTTGIILRRINFSEADRIITFLTPDRGKVEAIAKGVRRINAKLGSHLELFGEVELMLARGKNLDVVTSARLKTKYDKLTSDYERLRRAFLFCEMINKLTESHTSQQLYNLLRKSLMALDGGLQPPLVELYFKLHLLEEMGHQPHLKTTPAQKYYFSLAAGRVVTNRQAGAMPLSENEIKLWRLLLDYPLRQIAGVKRVGEAASSSLNIIDHFYDYLFGKRFKSSEI